MTDIVDQLRSISRRECADAAKEIELLRHMLYRLTSESKCETYLRAWREARSYIESLHARGVQINVAASEADK